MKNVRKLRMVLVVAIPALLAVAAAGAYVAFPSNGATHAVAAQPQQQDGAVTMAEYEAAVTNTAACLEANGLGVEVVPADRLRPPSVRVTARDADGVPDKDSVDDMHARTAGCLKQHLEPVADTWYRQHQPTPSDLAALYQGLQACIADGASGTPELVPDALLFRRYPDEPWPFEVAPEDNFVYARCAWEYQARTGFLPPMTTRMGTRAGE